MLPYTRYSTASLVFNLLQAGTLSREARLLKLLYDLFIDNYKVMQMQE